MVNYVYVNLCNTDIFILDGLGEYLKHQNILRITKCTYFTLTVSRKICLRIQFLCFEVL